MALRLAGKPIGDNDRLQQFAAFQRRHLTIGDHALGPLVGAAAAIRYEECKSVEQSCPREIAQGLTIKPPRGGVVVQT